MIFASLRLCPVQYHELSNKLKLVEQNCIRQLSFQSILDVLEGWFWTDMAIAVHDVFLEQ